MKATVLIGVLCLVLGFAALAYQGITYVTRETVVEAGPVKVQTERERTIPLPPIVGVAALAIGTLLLLFSGRKSV